VNKIKIIIRILIVFVFFAPFITCKHPMQESAATPVVSSDTSLHITDSMLLNDTAKTIAANKTDSNIISHSNIWNKIADKIVHPIGDSISGLGIIFSQPSRDNYFQMILSLSLVISIFLIFNWNFLKKKRIRLILSILNFILIGAFIGFNLYGDVWKILWGAWLLLGLIIADIVLQILIKKKSSNSII
jgi:hypothetical protein